MIKTLRITSIVAAVLAAAVLVFPAVFGSRGNTEVKKFLASVGAVEKFQKEKGSRSSPEKDKEPPLVKQAKAFALYLNPPEPEKKAPKTTTRTEPKPSRQKPSSVSAKFKLIGTSFYESNPSMSLALIDLPGKGFRWVQQSEKVGHLIIEDVKNGSITIRDGEKTSEMIAERPPRKSLVKGKGEKGRKSDGLTTEEDEMAQKIFAELAAMGADSEKTEPDRAAQRDVLKRHTPSMRIKDNEAKRLKLLGDELKRQKNPPKPRAKKMTEEERAMAERLFAELEAIATSEKQQEDTNSPPKDSNSETKK